MTPRDARIDALRVLIAEAQEPLQSRDVWELAPHLKRALVERVSAEVTKLRREQNRLIKEREKDRESGIEVDPSGDGG